MHGDIKEQHRRHRRSTSSTASNHGSQRTDRPIPQPSGLFARIQTLRTAANTISSLSSLLPFTAPSVHQLVSSSISSASDANGASCGSPPRINISVDVHTRMHSEHPGSVSYVMDENGSQTYAIWAGSPHPNRRRTPTSALVYRTEDTQETGHDAQLPQTATSLPDPTHIYRSESAITKPLNSHPRRSRRAQQVSPTHVKRLLSNFYEPSQPLDDHNRPSAIKPDYVNVPSLDPSPVLSDRTPPLTPDSFHDAGDSLPSVTPRLRFQSDFDEEGLGLAFEDNTSDLVDFEHSYGIQNTENRHRRADYTQEDGVYAPALSRSVRQGKMPLYLTEGVDDRPETTDNIRDPEALADVVDDEEWVGLKYTLKLSTRERHRTQSQQPIIEGEHSKSRASWAMLHQEVTHPAMIEEEFYHWREWHKFLEQHEQREKQRKSSYRYSPAVQQQNNMEREPTDQRNSDNEKQVKEGAWWLIGSKKEPKLRRGLSCSSRGNSFERTVSNNAHVEHENKHDNVPRADRPQSFGCIRDLHTSRFLK